MTGVVNGTQLNVIAAAAPRALSSSRKSVGQVRHCCGREDCSRHDQDGATFVDAFEDFQRDGSRLIVDEWRCALGGADAVPSHAEVVEIQRNLATVTASMFAVGR